MLVLKKHTEEAKKVAVIVAHPDDETLWAGGTILSHPSWKCFIVSLCRSSDADRAAKFNNALKKYKCEGAIGDLDDGPDQKPLADELVEHAILKLLPQQEYDLIITHNPSGEYTRHLRHEEISNAVINLWDDGKIVTSELWTFAYNDKNRKKLPMPVKDAPNYRPLASLILKKKQHIISEIYGFDADSWEAKATTQAEAFYQFIKPAAAKAWLDKCKP